MTTLQTKHGLTTGFFSNCSVRLHQIVRYFNKHKRLPDAVCSRGQFHFYKDDPDTDVAKILFVEDEMKIPRRHRIDFIHVKQFSNYKLLTFDDINPLVKKYFTISDRVARREAELTAQYQIDFANTIAVIYRGNDKITETALPPYEAFFARAQQLAHENPSARFLVQTDELEFLQQFRTRFPSTINFETLPPIPKDSGKAIVPAEHERLAFAVEFLAAVHGLSRCRLLLLGSGNVDLWAVLFRGHADGVHQYLNGRFVDRDNVPLGRIMVKLKRWFGKIGWVYRWIGRRYFGFRPV